MKDFGSIKMHGTAVKKKFKTVNVFCGKLISDEYVKKLLPIWDAVR